MKNRAHKRPDGYDYKMERNAVRLEEAAASGNLRRVLALAKRVDPKVHDSFALTRAAMNGHLECVRVLIPVSNPKADGSRALRMAAANGHAPTVSALIPFSSLRAAAFDALYGACQCSSLDCVKALIPASSTNARSRALPVAAVGAATTGRRDILEELLASGVNMGIALRYARALAAQFKQSQWTAAVDILHSIATAAATENALRAATATQAPPGRQGRPRVGM